ncbi:MAG TPA: ankyrin repeat domain-containing protein [Spirochaetota bacterium]|nr:ankyrin repeat domain-containing protein [Spirochaetota bacterium]
MTKGALAMQAGQTEKALLFLDEALTRDFLHFNSRMGKSFALINLGRVEEAVDLIRRSISLSLTVEERLMADNVKKIALARIGDENRIAEINMAIEEKNIAESTWLQLMGGLLASGEGINELSPETGYTPLHGCAHHGYVRAAKSLLDNKADVSVLSRDGKTANEIALERGNAEVAYMIQQSM